MSYGYLCGNCGVKSAGYESLGMIHNQIDVLLKKIRFSISKRMPDTAAGPTVSNDPRRRRWHTPSSWTWRGDQGVISLDSQNNIFRFCVPLAWNM
jgi:hypothetical protein